MSEDPKIQRLHEMRAKSRQGGGQERVETPHKRAWLTPRERIELLLDRGSFVMKYELSLR